MSANNDADYVVIEAVEDSMCHIEIGHCCVVELDVVVPLEWLTGILSGVISDTCKNVKDNVPLMLYDRFATWKEPFKSEIRAKIK